MAPFHPSAYSSTTESKEYLDSLQEDYFTARFFCDSLLSGLCLLNKKLVQVLLCHAVGGGKPLVGNVCFGVPLMEIQANSPTYLCYKCGHGELDAFKKTGTYLYEAIFPYYWPKASVDITGTKFHGIWWRAVSKFFVVHD
ncbi:hypothetical protein ACA910_021180 [Epithemia clementina (nom. ined.)]